MTTKPNPAASHPVEAPSLRDALKLAKDSLIAFKLMPGPHNVWEEHDEENLCAINAALAAPIEAEAVKVEAASDGFWLAPDDLDNSMMIAANHQYMNNTTCTARDLFQAVRADWIARNGRATPTPQAATPSATPSLVAVEGREQPKLTPDQVAKEILPLNSLIDWLEFRAQKSTHPDPACGIWSVAVRAAMTALATPSLKAAEPVASEPVRNAAQALVNAWPTGYSRTTHEAFAALEAALAASPAPRATGVQTSAPERIYLVVGENCPTDARWDQLVGVTWCEDNVDGNGIQYVRSDLTPPPVSEDTKRLDWLPIESAPKDGNEVLLYWKECVVGSYDSVNASTYEPARNWYVRGANKVKTSSPTHWMPLPPPPVDGAKKEGASHE